MDRRTFIQGTTTAALTVSALPQTASASPSKFVVGGIPAHVVESIYEVFGDGGFTCLQSDSWGTAEFGLTVFRSGIKEDSFGESFFNPTWPIFDQPFEFRVEEVSLAGLAERMSEVSPDDPTVAVYQVAATRKLGLVRYDLRERVAHVSLASVTHGNHALSQEARDLLNDRCSQIEMAWHDRLAQRNTEARQLTRENSGKAPGVPVTFRGHPFLPRRSR
jgi:hypothetical protein